MRGTTFKRCGCRSPETGKPYDTKCPDIRKKNHGSWWARYDAPAGADGKRRRPRIGPYRTKELAEDALAKELAKIGYDGQASDRGVKVGQYLDRWLAGKIDLKPSTLSSYREAVDLYLKPGFGHVRLVDLRDDDISGTYAAMLQLNRPEEEKQPSEILRRLIEVRAASPRPGAEKGSRKSRKPLSPARVKRVHAVANSALNAAVKSKKIAHNPAAYVTLPRYRSRKPLVWTAERVARWEETGKVPGPVMVWSPQQTGTFLDFAEATGERLYPLYHLVAYRGLRRGEAAGLPWAETDLAAGTATIRETRPDDDLNPDDTKSESGERTVSLDSGTVDSLKAWRKQQATERLAAGPIWQDTGLVFTREDGAPYRPEYLSQRFEVLIERYAAIRRRAAEGWSVEHIARRHRTPAEAVEVALSAPLPPVRFHDLRHGSATLSLAAGVDMKIVSETLGHARSSFTADVYVSVIPEVAKAAAEAVAAVVPRRNGPTMAPHNESSAPAKVVNLDGSAGQGGGSGI